MVVLELGRPPERPLSLNQARGMHWADVRRQTDPWKLLAWSVALNAGLADVIRGEPCVVTVHIPFRTNHRRDPHNFVPVCKAVVDGLVKAKVWPDDTAQFVTVTEPVCVVDPKMKTPASVHIVPRAA